MIVRVWRGRVATQYERAYIEHLTRRVFPAFRTIKGFVGGSLLKEKHAESVEFMVITRSTSMDAIRAFAGSDLTKAVIEPAAEAILLDYDRTVKHYDLEAEISGASN